MLRRLFSLVLLVLVAWALWTFRSPLLALLGGLVVEESAPARADLVIVLAGNPVLAAAEAAALVKDGWAPRVLVLARPAGPDHELATRLRLTLPRAHELAIQVLRRSGIRPSAIATEPIERGGTNAAVLAAARYARREKATRLAVVTYRSHTRRTAWLLRRALPEGSLVIMRSQRDDPFRPERWWHERESAREFVTEALRWLNSAVLGDLWRRERTGEARDARGQPSDRRGALPDGSEPGGERRQAIELRQLVEHRVQ